ncbi:MULTISPECIES: histidinol-phosphate transaminase [unclassified Brevibacterium]|uniref:histidinol-phosphate transaminase n=1 Tax=unclassified Brevibacterium TaxID=2614124 RepID=UPI0010931806|nr:histidinol-phosphate transaminase [Brevibacterium sp. S22]TGD32649.1 aminotransferase class I/II-fold pyridoxal phosphate-dependent enzyme [Brevibacterium sp. S22]
MNIQNYGRLHQLEEGAVASLSIVPREPVATLPAYSAGSAAPASLKFTSYKLSSNESPLGPVPAAAMAASSVTSLNRYPNPGAELLREALADHLAVPFDDIVAGAGSLGALTQIVSAFAGTNSNGTLDEVIYSWRSFEAYPIVVRTAGAKPVEVPNDEDGSHDLEAMSSAVTQRTKIIILCTPNNPTGPALTHAEIVAFLDSIPRHVVVVIDEAYHEFVRSPDPVETLKIYFQHPNVAVLRTFSKAHGLAALRVGYSIAQNEITQHLRKTATTFAVSSVAESAAIASLEHYDQVNGHVSEIVKERNRVTTALSGDGWAIPSAQGNFVWLPLGAKSLDFSKAAWREGLAVRAFDGEGVRVTIGEYEANSRIIELCRAYMALDN